MNEKTTTEVWEIKVPIQVAFDLQRWINEFNMEHPQYPMTTEFKDIVNE